MIIYSLKETPLAHFQSVKVGQPQYM